MDGCAETFLRDSTTTMTNKSMIGARDEIKIITHGMASPPLL
jgi:hypothetical protein